MDIQEYIADLERVIRELRSENLDLRVKHQSEYTRRKGLERTIAATRANIVAGINNGLIGEPK